MKKKEDTLTTALKTLKEQGMPVLTALFKDAVRNENRFTHDSNTLSRRAEMTLTAAGLLAEQKGTKPLLIANGNIKYMEMG